MFDRIEMRKEFNVTGTCNPQLHYMVDINSRFQAVREMIEQGRYFTINRARQFGKTTLLRTIWRKLTDRYLVIPISFEGVGDTAFASETGFVKMFCRMMGSYLERVENNERLSSIWMGNHAETLDELSMLISCITRESDKPVVLTIDEVDKSSDNQLFLSFLGMLRGKYLNREVEGWKSTFHSVILAGVYDVKNLKLRLRPDAEQKYNSPWNIAADFTVDMSFHPGEIAQMLSEYEQDVKSGMDIKAISEDIYRYTSGYPFLVSFICKLVDEQLDRNWTEEGILQAVKRIVRGGSTLLDDLAKNLENYPEFRDFIFRISFNSEPVIFTLMNPMISMGNMFSYIKEKDGRVVIHNMVFEEAVFQYFTTDYAIRQGSRLAPFQADYLVDGHLNMTHILTRFQDLMREEYRKEDDAFLERNGRLVFLSFLKPIVNGTGFYYVEPQTRENKRMDLIVTYGSEEYVVELKIGRGQAYIRNGREQLAEYLFLRGKSEGYLLIFDFSPKKQPMKPRWVEVKGKRIFEVWV